MVDSQPFPGTRRPDSDRSDTLLDVRALRVEFPTREGSIKAVDGVSFALERGRALGVVGESGSGKSVMALAILGLLNRRSALVSGQIYIGETDVITAPNTVVRRLRGRRAAMVFQDPLSALHPHLTVGHQIAEAYRVHTRASRRAAKRRAVEMLERVGIPSAARRAAAYPHELSGGMRQRAMIAMALVCDPELLIADEPTTALDVTVQAQILGVINELRTSMNAAVIFITHDLGVVAEVADDVLVMYAGRVVEKGSADDVFYTPEHPYTWGLLSSTPRLDRVRETRLPSITGSPPSPFAVPSGCAFHPRCAYGRLNGNKSQEIVPTLERVGEGHEVACHLSHEERGVLFASDIAPHL
jgi:peptide/nickel transport system ATP-binding protein